LGRKRCSTDGAKPAPKWWPRASVKTTEREPKGLFFFQSPLRETRPKKKNTTSWDEEKSPNPTPRTCLPKKEKKKKQLPTQQNSDEKDVHET
jgi:hypothetical protein